MGLLDRAKVFVASKDQNYLSQRAVNAEDFGLALSSYFDEVDAGEDVVLDTAMRAAMGACVRLLADDISTLPWTAYRRTSNGGREPLAVQPGWMSYPSGDPWDTPEAHVSDAVVSLLTDGNLFLEGLPLTTNPSALMVLNPSIVDITKGPDGMPRYKVSGQEFDGSRIAHVPWVRLPGERRGLNMVDQARSFTGLELAARRWAGNYFENGGTMGNVIVLPQGVKAPDRETLAEIREEIDSRHKGARKSWLTGILSGGATIHDGSIKPQEAELSPLWAHVLEEAARFYHIPPHLLASQAGGASYASVEHRSIEYVVHAVVPVVTRLERVYSRFIPGDDTFVKFNVNALMRGDHTTRANASATELQNRIITRDEWRAREDYGPAPEGEGGYLDTPNNQTTDPKLEDLSKLIRAGFDPVESAAYIGLPPIKHLGFSPTTQYVLDEDGESAGEDPADGPAENTQSQRVYIDTVSLPEDAAAAIADAAAEGAARAVETSAETSNAAAAGFTAATERMTQTLEDVLSTLDRATTPEESHIERDADGRAVAIIKRRGNKVVRHVIERDADGNAISVKN